MKKQKSKKRLESLRTVVRRQMGKLYRLCETKAHLRWYKGAKAHIEKQIDKLPKGIKVVSVGYTRMGQHRIMIIRTDTGHKYHMKYDTPAEAGWSYPSIARKDTMTGSHKREMPEKALYHDDNYYADRVAEFEDQKEGKKRIQFWRKHNQLTEAPKRSSQAGKVLIKKGAIRKPRKES